ncbi:MAG: response regulator [Candidatus Aminicenantes bacterium]|jgi:DNA-binding NtrC family response regulator
MKKNILLVEHNTDDVDMIKEILNLEIFDITVAGDEKTAKKLLKNQEFPLVITEALLPKSHGFTLCQYISEHYPAAKIIIISEKLKEVDYKNEALEHGACEFLEKPFDAYDFREIVSKHLDINKKEPVKYKSETTKINILPLLDKEKSKEEKKPETEDKIIDDLKKETHPYEIKLD